MDLKAFIEKITSVERQLDLAELQINGFNPWPYIRLSILNKYNLLESNREQVTTKREGGEITTIGKILSLGKSFLMYISNPVKKEDIDILYFTRQSENHDVINHNRFNRYSDSFKYFFAKKYRIKTIEICDQKCVKGNDKDTTYIDVIVKKARVKTRLSAKTALSSDKLYNVVQIIEKEFGFLIDAEADLKFIHYLSIEFVEILKAYNPKLVFLTVFYRLEAMAMSLACHKLGIRIVEYQHGAQNDYHSMYTNWEKMPSSGYELIPDRFWMWGEVSKNRIDQWANKTAKHKAFVGGNIWLTYAREQKPNSLELSRYYKQGNSHILISLQGDNFFADFLFDIISIDLNKKIIWHFRDHPRLPLSIGLKNRIKSLPNCEIDFSSTAPLYELLKYSDIHITGYSTIAFEAQSFGVPTIFTHTNALSGYKELINTNGLFYADNLERLNVLLNKLLFKNIKIRPSYIVSDLVEHEHVLSLLME